MASNRKARRANKAASDPPLVDISEADQWRIIRESGVLSKVETSDSQQPPSSSATAKEEQLLSPFWEEFFAATALIIPHCFLLLMMEILAHFQYGRNPTLAVIADRMIPGVPIISIGIWYSNRYKNTQWMQLILFALGAGCGSRMIWVLNHSNWRDVMKFTPPLATAWVYAIMQLNLPYALLNLLVTYGFIWYKNLNLFPKP